MSDPSADAPGSGRRATLGGVVQVALGLALLALALAALARPRSAPADPRERLASWFALGELPFGLEPVEAYTLAGGEQVVALASTRAAAKQAPAAGVTESEPPPEEVLVVAYPRAGAARAIAELFKTDGGVPGSGGPHGGGPPPGGGGDGSIERGELVWHEFSVRYVRKRERKRENADTFRDTVRVDLASDARPCVLFARWGEGVAGSIARTGELLAALAPRNP